MGKFNPRKMKEHHKKEDQKSSRSSGNNFTVDSKGSVIALLPPHDNMDGMPIVKINQHWLGKNVKCNIPYEKVLSGEEYSSKDCFICSRRKKEYDDLDDDGKRMLSRNKHRLCNVVDLTGLFNEKLLKQEEELPKCFLRFEEVSKEQPKKCKRCPVVDGCKGGVRVFRMSQETEDKIREFFEETDYKRDITNGLRGFIPIRVTRKGTGFNTKYSSRVLERTRIKVSKSIMSLIEENVIDVTSLYSEVTNKEMKKLYEQMSEEDEDDEDDEEEIENRKKKAKAEMEDDEDDEEEDDEDDEDFEEEVKKRNKKKRTSSKKKSSKKKTSKKKREEEEDDEEDEDEDLEEDDDENDDDDDDDDDDWDD